jgi:hypothetical protein
MSVLTVRKGAYVPGTVQNFTTSGTSQASNAVASTSSIIRVTTNQDVFVSFGSSPTATTSSMLMVAGSTEFISVEPGVTKVAVIQSTTSGIFSMTELTGY